MYDIVLPQLGMPEIEVNTSDGWVDLHNFANFRSLTYDTHGSLKLSWELVGDQGSNLGGNLLTWVDLHFSGVTQWQITPRDPEVPQAEDQSLEHFRLIESSTESLRLVFDFIGGSTIDVTCQAVGLTAQRVSD